jgi:hypothetical protein
VWGVPASGRFYPEPVVRPSLCPTQWPPGIVVASEPSPFRRCITVSGPARGVVGRDLAHGRRERRARSRGSGRLADRPLLRAAELLDARLRKAALDAPGNGVARGGPGDRGHLYWAPTRVVIGPSDVRLRKAPVARPSPASDNEDSGTKASKAMHSKHSGKAGSTPIVAVPSDQRLRGGRRRAGIRCMSNLTR